MCGLCLNSYRVTDPGRLEAIHRNMRKLQVNKVIGVCRVKHIRVAQCFVVCFAPPISVFDLFFC